MKSGARFYPIASRSILHSRSIIQSKRSILANCRYRLEAFQADPAVLAPLHPAVDGRLVAHLDQETLTRGKAGTRFQLHPKGRKIAHSCRAGRTPETQPRRNAE